MQGIFWGRAKVKRWRLALRRRIYENSWSLTNAVDSGTETHNLREGGRERERE